MERWRYAFTREAHLNTKTQSKTTRELHRMHIHREKRNFIFDAQRRSAALRCRHTEFTVPRDEMERCNSRIFMLVSVSVSASIFGLYSPIYVLSFESEPYYHRSRSEYCHKENYNHKHYSQINSNK